jgi:CCR4-NOT transcription complex subunit 7/8
VEIIDVWQENLELEMNKIKTLIKNYPVVAFDTEFPGFPFQNHDKTFK